MKKTPYIGKYDYVDYYTKQPAFWFFTNAEIHAAIKLEKEKLKLKDLIDDEDDEEELEFDSYEFYKQSKEEFKNVDKDNPKILEGIIIDKASRQHIKNKFKKIKNVFDLDEEQYHNKSNEELAAITKDIILKYDNVILFQPVFIHDYLITKPDAIIIKDKEITLIETKGTTTSKRSHFLDLFFQFQVVSKVDYLFDNDYYFDLNLCLVKYCYANKNEVPLIITPNINITKTVSIVDKSIGIDNIQSIKIGDGFVVKNKTNGESTFILNPIDIKNLCEANFKDIEERMDFSVHRSKTCEQMIEQLDIIHSEFDKVCKQLKERKDFLVKNNKLEVIDEILPSTNEKSFWKNSDLFPQLRTLYAKKGYTIFNYSGNLVDQTADAIKSIQKYQEPFGYFKKEENIDYFKPTSPNITINKVAVETLLSKLKNKKVYFDFETINSPIRAIDHCLPFMQIITQCSIIIDHDDKTPIKDLKCNNIVIDPMNITIQDFKEVVDSLYCGDEYSYIVYNKSFERSRLREMKQYINESEYSKKIDIIIDNLFDLANFFEITADTYKKPVIIKELGGFYSIKKVLPFVMENYKEIFDETGCVDYYSLNVVQNGLICQTETTKRFHSMLSDQEWQNLVINLKKYCENDVRAMVAVEYFVRKIYATY